MRDYDSVGKFCHTEFSLNKSTIIFSGQGNPVLGMGKQVCDCSPEVKTIWDCASDISGVDIRRLCFRGPMTRLIQTRYQQLAVTTINIAMFEILKTRYELGSVVYLGHSIGEYSALYAAGVFQLEDVFKIVNHRAEIMQSLAEETSGLMYVVKEIDYFALNALIYQHGFEERIKIANDNSPKQQVISGQDKDIKTFSLILLEKQLPLLKLPVNGAWHSHLMSAGIEEFQSILASMTLCEPITPIYMNRVARRVHEPNEIKQHLSYHLAETVRWRESIEACYQDGYRNFIELSQKKIFNQMLMQHFSFDEPFTVTHFSQLIT